MSRYSDEYKEGDEPVDEISAPFLLSESSGVFHLPPFHPPPINYPILNTLAQVSEIQRSFFKTDLRKRFLENKTRYSSAYKVFKSNAIDREGNLKQFQEREDGDWLLQDQIKFVIIYRTYLQNSLRKQYLLRGLDRDNRLPQESVQKILHPDEIPHADFRLQKSILERLLKQKSSEIIPTDQYHPTSKEYIDDNFLDTMFTDLKAFSVSLFGLVIYMETSSILIQTCLANMTQKRPENVLYKQALQRFIEANEPDNGVNYSQENQVLIDEVLQLTAQSQTYNTFRGQVDTMNQIKPCTVNQEEIISRPKRFPILNTLKNVSTVKRSIFKSQTRKMFDLRNLSEAVIELFKDWIRASLKDNTYFELDEHLLIQKEVLEEVLLQKVNDKLKYTSTNRDYFSTDKNKVNPCFLEDCFQALNRFSVSVKGLAIYLVFSTIYIDFVFISRNLKARSYLNTELLIRFIKANEPSETDFTAQNKILIDEVMILASSDRTYKAYCLIRHDQQQARQFAEHLFTPKQEKYIIRNDLDYTYGGKKALQKQKRKMSKRFTKSSKKRRTRLKKR
jgi:hypothetical protein